MDYQKYMKGGQGAPAATLLATGAGDASTKDAKAQPGDYQQYMDYQKYMQGGQGGQGGQGNYQQYMDYQKFMKGQGGAGGYQQYMDYQKFMNQRGASQALIATPESLNTTKQLDDWKAAQSKQIDGLVPAQ